MGDLDTTTPIYEARVLVEHIPNTDLKVLREAGHLSNIDASEEFSTTIIEFLKPLKKIRS